MEKSRKVTTVVPVATLKARLSEHLRLVKGGRELVVTERGRAIARILPVSGAAEQDSRLEELIAAGAVRPPRRPLAGDFWQRRRARDPAGRSLAALLAERDEGR